MSKFDNIFGKDGKFDDLMDRFGEIVDEAFDSPDKAVRIRLTDAQIGLLLTGVTLSVRMSDGLVITLEKK